MRTEIPSIQDLLRHKDVYESQISPFTSYLGLNLISFLNRFNMYMKTAKNRYSNLFLLLGIEMNIIYSMKYYRNSFSTFDIQIYS